MIANKEGLEYLKTIESDSIDLVLTDPPYITSKESGMNKWVQHVEEQNKTNAKDIKTPEEFVDHKTLEKWHQFFRTAKTHVKYWSKKYHTMKQDYLKYGSIYGEKYARVTDFGDWDRNFTLQKLDLFVSQFSRVLKKGGTAIIFFDLWKISDLKKILEDNGFKQIRFIEWVKTNPQPLNSKTNYLTNCREVALSAVKGGKPTFNSKYDNAIYEFPTQAGKNRFHPTQKSLALFKALIEKHSNPGDVVLDPFLGAGTTAVAAKELKRNFVGCEIDEEFYKKSIDWLKKS